MQYEDGKDALQRQIQESLLHIKYEAQGLCWLAAKRQAAADMAQFDRAQEIHDQSVLQQRRAAYRTRH